MRVIMFERCWFVVDEGLAGLVVLLGWEELVCLVVVLFACSARVFRSHCCVLALHSPLICLSTACAIVEPTRVIIMKTALSLDRGQSC